MRQGDAKRLFENFAGATIEPITLPRFILDFEHRFSASRMIWGLMPNSYGRMLSLMD